MRRYAPPKKKKRRIIPMIGVFIIMLYVAIIVRTLGINDPTVVPEKIGGQVLFIEGQAIHDKNPILQEGENVWLPFETVKKYIDPTLQWDSKYKVITITMQNELIRMNLNSTKGQKNNEPFTFTVPVIQKANVIYVPISDLKEVYSLQIQRLVGNEGIIITLLGKSHQSGMLTVAETKVKAGKSFFSSTVETIRKGEKLIIFEMDKNYAKVRSSSGKLGYISKSDIGDIKTIPSKYLSLPPKHAKKVLNQKVLLTWEYAFDKKVDTQKIPDMKGLNVISPTWFKIVDGKGTISSSAEKDYIQWAKKRGYQVWPLVQSFDPKITKAVLNDLNVREKLLQQLLFFARMYELDGYNMDFENVNVEEKNALTQFMRELYALCNSNGLTLSMDVTPISGSLQWSQFYDRPELSKVVDYMMLMGYDEHWAASPEAGSVSSIDWLESKLQDILKQVPANKLVLGVPFYTRLWKETGGKVTSQTLSMEDVNGLLTQNKLHPKWNETDGQYYVEWKSKGITYKIWIEDSKSLDLKLKLVDKYKLAGAASWRRGFEVPSIWQTMNGIFKTR